MIICCAASTGDVKIAPGAGAFVTGAELGAAGGVSCWARTSGEIRKAEAQAAKDKERKEAGMVADHNKESGNDKKRPLKSAEPAQFGRVLFAHGHDG